MTLEGMKTHYETLDIPASATPEQVRKAFRTLAFVYHPDLAGPSASDTDLFMQIREAYEVLIDQNRRRTYDELLERLREEERRKRAANERLVSVERPLPRQVYSPFYAEQRLSRPIDAELMRDITTPQLRSQDLYGSIEISLEETLHPCTFSLVVPDTPGAVLRGKIQIRLPGGIFRGAILRVPECGIAEGNVRGDLFVETVIAQHPNFRLCAESVFYDLPVMPWHAALGFDATVPTLDGFEKVPIPPLISTPSVKRLAGKGIYKRNGERGDLWINLKLEVPPPTSYRSRRLWAELAEEYRHSQRTQ
jgi:curved DNA-binding protein